MELFSKRNGLVEELKLQKEDITYPLYSILFNKMCEQITYIFNHQDSNEFQKIYHEYFLNKMRTDYFGNWNLESFIKNELKADWKKISWHRKYSLIELVYLYADTGKDEEKSLNNGLERGKSAYRMINHEIVEITDENESQSIKDVFEDESLEDGIKQHLSKALTLLSVSETPDYKNSIKESISAVEYLLRDHTGESTLGKALTKFERITGLPNQLKEGLNKIYNYTNGSGGIRHALMQDREVDFNEAKFMLVSCTAFINYLKVLKVKDD